MLRRILHIFAFALVAVLVGITLLWWSCGPHQPSDATLEEQFRGHRTGLERIVAMMGEDRQMSRIAFDFLWRQDTVAWPRPESEWGISAERWDDYRRVFREVGARDGSTRGENSSDVIINVWSWGIVPAGIGVGYLHCGLPKNGSHPTEPPCIQIQDAGKGMFAPSTSYGCRYKRIAPDWFIYETSN